MPIQDEICPWCEAKIQVSCGVRPCPACGKRISGSLDEQGLDLMRQWLGRRERSNNHGQIQTSTPA